MLVKGKAPNTLSAVGNHGSRYQTTPRGDEWKHSRHKSPVRVNVRKGK
jgi:hypothetical protein